MNVYESKKKIDGFISSKVIKILRKYKDNERKLCIIVYKIHREIVRQIDKISSYADSGVKRKNQGNSIKSL